MAPRAWDIESRTPPDRPQPRDEAARGAAGALSAGRGAQALMEGLRKRFHEEQLWTGGNP
jgi:hypothetical protein